MPTKHILCYFLFFFIGYVVTVGVQPLVKQLFARCDILPNKLMPQVQRSFFCILKKNRSLFLFCLFAPNVIVNVFFLSMCFSTVKISINAIVYSKHGLHLCLSLHVRS